ncbi:MAG: HNH endonuclease [Streptomycetaceae bacterium]|nr:HNH endonuclease [Streptomycetaceae bacterium]NUS54767.1 HNH endonuclease [Streptomycetaceae bacterium]
MTRSTSNRNARGNTIERRRRREWLVDAFRADVDVIIVTWPEGHTSQWTWRPEIERDPRLARAVNWVRMPACRCYRCGNLLTVDTVTVDRRLPGVHGGTYTAENCRPACGHCNSSVGGKIGAARAAGVLA